MTPTSDYFEVPELNVFVLNRGDILIYDYDGEYTYYYCSSQNQYFNNRESIENQIDRNNNPNNGEHVLKKLITSTGDSGSESGSGGESADPGMAGEGPPDVTPNTPSAIILPEDKG